MCSRDDLETTSLEPTIEALPIEAVQEPQEAEPVEESLVLDDASVAVPRRRRLQVGEWYVTLAMVGALVGLFIAGILVALNQAFPEGESGNLNAGAVTGISIGIIAGASALGALMAGAAQLVGWGWRRARGAEVTTDADRFLAADDGEVTQQDS